MDFVRIPRRPHKGDLVRCTSFNAKVRRVHDEDPKRDMILLGPTSFPHTNQRKTDRKIWCHSRSWEPLAYWPKCREETRKRWKEWNAQKQRHAQHVNYFFKHMYEEVDAKYPFEWLSEFTDINAYKQKEAEKCAFEEKLYKERYGLTMRQENLITAGLAARFVDAADYDIYRRGIND